MTHDCQNFISDLLEGLVDGPEPADIRAGGEHEEPDNSHSKVSHATTTKHPGKAANQIHHKSSTIHCASKTKELYFRYKL